MWATTRKRMGFAGVDQIDKIGHRLEMGSTDKVGVGALDWGLGLGSAKVRKNRFEGGQ